MEMTEKTNVETKSETFYMTEFHDEDFINSSLEDLGFDLRYTTWIYSWTVPPWMEEQKKAETMQRLEDSDFHHYLVNVKQVTPK